MDKPVKLSLVADVYRADSMLPVLTVTVSGRPAFALMALLQAGPKGCTPITRPAPRWSDYVFKLRGLGIDVETIHEGHDGPFAGHHARYVLKDGVELYGGTLDAYLASPEGRREFGNADFLSRRRAA